MAEIIDFLIKHWVLSSVLVTLLGFYIAVEVFYSQDNNRISSQAAVDFINHYNATIIDIRPKEAFDTSHIIDAINIPSDQLSNNMKKIQKYLKKPVIVVCAVGKNTAKVAAKLKENGFQQVLQLAGGMQEWVAAGLPTVSSKGKRS